VTHAEKGINSGKGVKGRRALGGNGEGSGWVRLSGVRGLLVESFSDLLSQLLLKHLYFAISANAN
jgi:hypothetical protein